MTSSVAGKRSPNRRRVGAAQKRLSNCDDGREQPGEQNDSGGHAPGCRVPERPLAAARRVPAQGQAASRGLYRGMLPAFRDRTECEWSPHRAGDRAFCAGRDIKDLGVEGRDRRAARTAAIVPLGACRR